MINKCFEDINFYKELLIKISMKIKLENLKGISVQQFYKIAGLEKATDEEKILKLKDLGIKPGFLKSSQNNLKEYEEVYRIFT